MAASIGVLGVGLLDDASFWAGIDGGAPVVDEATAYDAACIAVDAWRTGRALGVRRVSFTRWTKPGAPVEVCAFATESLGFIAKGKGATLEAATIDLARALVASTTVREAA